MGECVWGGSPVGRQEGRWEAEEGVGRRGALRVRGEGREERPEERGKQTAHGRWDTVPRGWDSCRGVVGRAGCLLGKWWKGHAGGSVVGSTDPGALWGRVPLHWGPVCVILCVGHRVTTLGPPGGRLLPRAPVLSPGGRVCPASSSVCQKSEGGAGLEITEADGLPGVLAGRWNPRGHSLVPAPLRSGSPGKGLDEGTCSY